GRGYRAAAETPAEGEVGAPQRRHDPRASKGVGDRPWQPPLALLSSVGFDLARAHAESAASDQRENAGVDPRRRLPAPALGQEPEPPAEPARLAAQVAPVIALDPSTTHRDLAHAQPLLGDRREDGRTQLAVEDYR